MSTGEICSLGASQGRSVTRGAQPLPISVIFMHLEVQALASETSQACTSECKPLHPKSVKLAPTGARPCIWNQSSLHLQVQAPLSDTI